MQVAFYSLLISLCVSVSLCLCRYYPVRIFVFRYAYLTFCGLHAGCFLFSFNKSLCLRVSVFVCSGKISVTVYKSPNYSVKRYK